MTTTTLLDALQRLQSALDTLALALTKGESDAVLAAEEPLASAVTALASVSRGTPADAIGLRQAISSVRAAVKRCESLGDSAGEFARAIFPQPAYGRRGLPPAHANRSRPFKSVR